MTQQEIYETSRDHLLTQNKQSTRPDDGNGGPRCAYRGDDGLKCAIGCLVSDEEYNPAMEGRSVVELFSAGLFAAVWFTADNLRLLSRLQGIHDGTRPSEWLRLLTEVAVKTGLKP